MKKTVHICGHCRADDHDCEINKGDEVEWVSDDNVAFSLIFKNNSPFAESQFNIPASGEPVPSGPAQSSGKFGYDIGRMDASMAADPNIIVR
jgi:hypothetical protein